MKKGLFITATSTGIGKTVISAIMCRILAEAGINTAYYKPVQTGGVPVNDTLVSSDCGFIERITMSYSNCKTYASYILKTPASPHYAGRLEGIKINLRKIKKDYKTIQSSNDAVIVEGAGGLFVPINDKKKFVSDIPKKLKINTIIIADAGLGAINHVALSYKYCRTKHIPVAAVLLLSDLEDPSDIEKENQNILKKLLKIKRILILPSIKNVETEKNLIGDIFNKIKYYPDSNTIKSWINE